MEVWEYEVGLVHSPMHRKSEKLQHPSLFCLFFGLQPVCVVAYKSIENKFLSGA